MCRLDGFLPLLSKLQWTAWVDMGVGKSRHEWWRSLSSVSSRLLLSLSCDESQRHHKPTCRGHLAHLRQ
ncbi:hypothetical protein E2C01_098884 [Portunus trituberculatus]|uniref:Uncharacterized protein n=1 Tax=Portunus trituberculatus TaxID=210409 RepID=A0A5B7K9J3_PORTR|nr:hypothetical protein [Portunus trituberculatus]